ncbi:MAG: DUF5134 domain-containing protein [Brachybacterium sp.]|uniref:DUF5134 domain-containing protein n=1 Tax=Brachybacterium sp. TaxID=1891286 RepID=UPI0026478323|nr:DUF5134 domain-containing protein [Brachybacterium sp.]MDN5686871.1 DUF5134 domain-containing protein [Brachybacterium sp.]
MIKTPWSLLLTAIFLATTVLCSVHLAQSRGTSTARPGRSPHAAHDGPVATTVHVNHLVMSLAMLLMVWRPVGTVGTWVQVTIFAFFGVLMLLGLPTVRGIGERIGTAGHVALTAAMIWMLLAMPLLMGHAVGSSGDAHAGHHGGGSDGAAAMDMIPTPAWASGVNWAAVVLSAVVSAWWLGRLLGHPAHRVHSACHLLMGAGMALMLALM